MENPSLGWQTIILTFTTVALFSMAFYLREVGSVASEARAEASEQRVSDPVLNIAPQSSDRSLFYYKHLVQP